MKYCRFHNFYPVLLGIGHLALVSGLRIRLELGLREIRIRASETTRILPDFDLIEVTLRNEILILFFITLVNTFCR